MTDLRYALRSLAASPRLTSVAILSLALGIGANTAIYSAIRVVLFDTLPVRVPEELVELGWTPGPDAGHHAHPPSVRCRAFERRKAGSSRCFPPAAASDAPSDPLNVPFNAASTRATATC